MSIKNLFIQLAKNKVQNFVLLLILLLAAFLRLYKIQDYMTFLGDEGRDVLVAYNILHGHLTLLGPTSSVGGFFLGPIYYYFMAPFLLLFNYNPVGPAVMIALFGIATVWLIYKIGSIFFGRTAGLCASLLYALSPLVLTYSHSSWNPNLMPFFTLLTLFVLYKAVLRKKYWLFFATGILYGVLMQLHYIEVFIGLIILVYIFIASDVFTKPFTNWSKKIVYLSKNYMAVFVGFIIGLSPYLAFELRHGFPNTLSIIKFIFHSPDIGGGGNFITTIRDVSFRIFARLVTDFPSPDHYFEYSQQILAIWAIGTVLLAILSVGFFLYRYLPLLKKKEDKFLQYTLVLLWMVLGVLLFGLYKKSIYDYYFEFLFPVPFLFVGFFISFLFSKKILLKIIASLILLILIFANLWGIPFRSTPNKQLNQMETIARFVNDKTQGQSFNFALISDGNSDYAYRYFFTIWAHPPITIQNAQNDPQRKTVTNKLLVICESPLTCHPLGNSLWEIAGFGQAEIINHWKISVVEVYELGHYKGK
jgi:4-amino-4-deoxy-L-arabinose transferase-like glycosyltransferase